MNHKNNICSCCFIPVSSSSLSLLPIRTIKNNNVMNHRHHHHSSICGITVSFLQQEKILKTIRNYCFIKYSSFENLKSFPMRCSTQRQFRPNTRLFAASPSLLINNGMDNDVFSTNDIVIGIGLAFILAALPSLLRRYSQEQDQKNTLDNTNSTATISKNLNITSTDTNNSTVSSSIIFDAKSWKEMSRPDNYIWYNPKIKKESGKNQQVNAMNNNKNNDQQKQEQQLILIAMLILFVPLFSVEIFFALSRQIICGDYYGNNNNEMMMMMMSHPASNDWMTSIKHMCSPHL